MRKNKINLPRTAAICCAASVLLAGCASVPHPSVADQASADYGESPSGYVAAVHAYFDSTMKDPSSTQYREVTAPTKGYMTSGAPISGYKLIYGWLVDATINAKNSYGGYVGFRTYKFLFRDDVIQETITPSDE